MAEQFASGRMFHLHGKLGVAPLNIAHIPLNAAQGRGQTLKLRKKLSAFKRTVVVGQPEPSAHTQRMTAPVKAILPRSVTL